MDVDGHGLCHLRQIRVIGNGCDQLPVGMFLRYVQPSDNLFTNHTDL
jgi:hypothetical protein